MKINKKLFEDVLSGKLKGTFVLRDGTKFKSSKLRRWNNSYPYAFTNIEWCSPLNYYAYDHLSYTSNGKWSIYIKDKQNNDIMDFIPDTNMKENELTIEIPKGKIVDWEESKKQNKIVLKDKQLTYEDICNKLQDMMVYGDQEFKSFEEIFNYGLSLCKWWKKKKAQDFFTAYIYYLYNVNTRKDVPTIEYAEQCAKKNFGYFAGYYGDDVRKKVYNYFGAVHPVFGNRYNVTNKEAFYAGVQIANAKNKNTINFA